MHDDFILTVVWYNATYVKQPEIQYRFNSMGDKFKSKGDKFIDPQ